MTSRDLVRRLRTAASSLKTAARWRGSGYDVDGSRNEYVYELLCYFTVCVAASQKFRLTIIARTDKKSGKSGAIWPRGPGKKARFSLIRLHDPGGHCHFELCPGIEIRDRHGMERAPDISLQRPNGDLPSHSDVHAIWEAKYRTEATRRLSGPEVSDFMVTFDVLGKPAPPKLWRDSVVTTFHCSGLLTNGCFSTEKQDHLIERGITETCGFPDSATTRPA